MKKMNVILTMGAALFASLTAFSQATVSAGKLPESVTITIDGKADEAVWNAVEAITLDSCSSNINGDPMIGDSYANPPMICEMPSETDLSVSYKLLWDETNIYLLVEAKDDAVVNYTSKGGDENGEVNKWDVDNVEAFFNPENILEQGALITSSQIRALVAEYDDGEYYNDFSAGGFAAYFPDSYIYETVETADGYVLEWQVPWTTIVDLESKTIEVGLEMGFTLNVGDCDGVETNREHIINWANNWVDDWRDNSRWGKLVLGEEVIVSNKQNELSNLNIYPSLATDQVTIENVNVNSEVNVLNTLGQVVMSTKANDRNLTLNVSSLVKGMYIVNVNGVSLKIIKK